MPKTKRPTGPAVTIPSSLADVSLDLNEIGADVNRESWRRAALVAAVAKPKLHAAADPSDTRETFTAFAARGLRGLSSRQTVAAVWATWAEHGTPQVPLLGSTVEVPSVDFADVYERGKRAPEEASRNEQPREEAPVETRRALLEDPDLVVSAINASPAVANAVAASDEAMEELEARRFSERTTGTPRGPREKPEKPARLDKDLVKAIKKLRKLLQAEAAGEFSIPPASLALMHYLAAELLDRLATWREGEAERSTLSTDVAAAAIEELLTNGGRNR